MATGNEYTTLTGLLKGIADALRAKIGTTAQINAQDFPSNIAGIPKAAGNASTSDVLSGVTFSNKNGGEQTGTMANNGAISKSISPGDSYTVPAGYHNGSGTVSAVANTGDAEVGHVLEGKTFYGSGATKQTGTMPQREQGTNTLSLGKDGIGIWSYMPYGYYPEYSEGKAYVYTDPSEFGNAGTGDVLSGVSFTSTAGLKVGGTMTNRGAWSTTINPGGSVTIPAGYHSGGGRVSAGSAEASSKIISKNTNYSVSGRSGSSIDISSECSVPNARISMIIAGGVGINDSGSQIGSTSVKAITTAGTEYTCQYSNGYYKVPTDTTYKKVVVYHHSYGGSEMAHGVIGPIFVFGY